MDAFLFIPTSSPAPLTKKCSFLGEAEIATGNRLAEMLGKNLEESAHIGADFVDDQGISYDAFSAPAASKHWNRTRKQFFKSFRKHLRKSNHYTVIDLTGFTESQIAEVDKYLQNLSPEELARIMRIGF